MRVAAAWRRRYSASLSASSSSSPVFAEDDLHGFVIIDHRYNAMNIPLRSFTGLR
jgi:hypothetical protein